jgi:hypothetical protein
MLKDKKEASAKRLGISISFSLGTYLHTHVGNTSRNNASDEYVAVPAGRGMTLRA